VAKVPYRCGVSIQELQTDYKAANFLSTLKHFLTSRATRDNIVLPVELDQIDVFSQLYVESAPSMVKGHSSVWQKICARPKVTAHGHKAKSPARFDTAFVWDKGCQQSFLAGPDGKYQVFSTRRVCTDKYLTASCAYHAGSSHFQAARASQGSPPSTGVH